MFRNKIIPKEVNNIIEQLDELENELRPEPKNYCIAPQNQQHMLNYYLHELDELNNKLDQLTALNAAKDKLNIVDPELKNYLEQRIASIKQQIETKKDIVLKQLHSMDYTAEIHRNYNKHKKPAPVDGETHVKNHEDSHKTHSNGLVSQGLFSARNVALATVAVAAFCAAAMTYSR